MVRTDAGALLADLDSAVDCDAGGEDCRVDDESCATQGNASNMNASANKTPAHVSAVDLEATMAETD
jgi:hypothetical protein